MIGYDARRVFQDGHDLCKFRFVWLNQPAPHSNGNVNSR